MNFAKQAGIFLLFVLGFWAISAMYLSPAIGGEKVLIQGDMQQVRLMRAEMDSFKIKHGEYPGWTDGLFSGMPTSLISGIPNGNYVYKTGLMELFHMVKTPFNFLFLAMLSMFILLLSSGVNRWLAAAGGIGYAFMTFSITSYEAGHITKVLAMDVMPGMLAGLVLLNKKKYLLGAAVLGVFWTLLVGYFHYQIAYYAGIVAAIFLVVEVLRAFFAKDIRHALILGGLGVACLAAGALSNIGKIVDTANYSEATMRGGSEVSSELPKNGPKPQVAKKGLERDYAFSWSYSPTECFTLLIPRFEGGGSAEKIDHELLGEGVRIRELYHGDLNFTSGPVYIGAVFIFLFILGIVSVSVLAKSDPVKYSVARGIMWFAIATTAISLMLAWGRFFSFNNFLFDVLPYYNKFRTPMMALSVTQMVVPFFGLYALQLLLQAENYEKVFGKIAKYTAMAAGGLMVMAALILLNTDFSFMADSQMNREDLAVIKEIRSSVAWKDWFRSFVFMIIPFGIVWWVVSKKGPKIALWMGILIFSAIDLIGISTRYLGEDNWQYKEEEEAIIPTPKDTQIIAVNKNYARVFDLRYGDPFSNAHSAPWHRSIGGYHPAKLSRYQDLISNCIVPGDGGLTMEQIIKNNALDILNCGYVLSMAQDKKSELAFPRSTALGNAWFVNKVVHVPTAKSALETINRFSPATQVVVEDAEKLKPSADSFMLDSNASIAVKKYSLDTITYTVNNANKGLAVFSEVYYNEKNGAWKAFADGKELPILRVNYILRGLELPAGTKEVKMVYNKQINQYLGVETATSGLLLVLLVVALGAGAIAKNGTEEQDA